MAEQFDIAVIGGGPTGQAAAIAAALAGYRTVLFAPPAPAHPARTAALMQPAVSFLDELGASPDSHEDAAPVVAIRLVDGTRRLLRAPEVTFHASEIGLERFGVNIPNAALIALFAARASRIAGLTVVEAPATAVTLGEAVCAIGSEAGATVEARLVVGADGRDSRVREAALIPMRVKAYRQSAVVAALTTSRQHGGVATEFHLEDGPFTLVPLAGDRLSLVWVDRPHILEEALSWSDRRFADEAERRSASVFGELHVDGAPAIYPLWHGRARKLAGPRLVLAGEAAHVMAPIGAQGLNLGFRDVAALAALLAGRPADPGAPELTRRYEARRRLDIEGRSLAVDLLNRSLLTGFLPVQALRCCGLSLAASVPAVRRLLMREGVGRSAVPAD